MEKFQGEKQSSQESLPPVFVDPALETLNDLLRNKFSNRDVNPREKDITSLNFPSLDFAAPRQGTSTKQPVSDLGRSGKDLFTTATGVQQQHVKEAPPSLAVLVDIPRRPALPNPFALQAEKKSTSEAAESPEAKKPSTIQDARHSATNPADKTLPPQQDLIPPAPLTLRPFPPLDTRRVAVNFKAPSDQNAKPATQELPRIDLPRIDLARTPRTDVPRTDLPRTDLPRTDLPRTEFHIPETTKSEPLDTKNVKLEDGSYKRDDKGRVVETISQDGKTKHKFEYADPAFPDRITSDTVNDKTTYRFIGNNKVDNKPYKIDGFEVNSYSTYENGQLTGNWSGVRSVSKNGVFSLKDDKTAKVEHFDASGGKLSDQQRSTREADGIWPSKIDLTRDDGTKLSAKLNGTRLESLSETVKENGQTKEIQWQKNGDKWLSNESPARERRNLSVTPEGTVKFNSESGVAHEIYKNGTRSEVDKDRIHRQYDAENKLAIISQPNGDSRVLKYTNGELSSIQDRIGGSEKTWLRLAGGNNWSDGVKQETRNSLKIETDGSMRFNNADGNAVREKTDLSRVTYDQQNRPSVVNFPSGSSRTFNYKGGELDSVTDSMRAYGKDTSTTWTREGNSNLFKSVAANGKTRTREMGAPNENGDYTYKTADGKDHTAKVRDVERLARGEIAVGSESVQEARDRFLDAAKERGLKMDRLEKYINEMDATSQRYGTKPEQIAKSLDNLSDILSAEKSPLYSKEELSTIVETGAHNIARPTEIDQGYHPTCNVTTTEVYAAARHPERYTDLLKQVAMSGSYKTSYGQTVTPPTAALLARRDEKMYDLDKPNVDRRNMASMIYQMTAVNGVYELGKHSSQKDQKDNGVRYIMGEVRKQQIPNGYVDLGEDLLVDKNGRQKMGRNGQPVDGPEFIQDDVVTASEMICGEKMPYIGSPYKRSDEAHWRFDIATPERLFKAKADGQFPLGVPTIRGAHVQTIHDVTKDSKGQTWVLLDNQHGQAKDGWVTIDELKQTQTQQMQLEPKRKPADRPN